MSEIEPTSKSASVDPVEDRDFDRWARDVGRELRRAAPEGGLSDVQNRRETRLRRRVAVASVATALVIFGVVGVLVARRAGKAGISNVSTETSITVPVSTESTQATSTPTTTAPTTLVPTTATPTTATPTTEPTTLAPTTLAPTTLAPTTLAPTTLAPTTLAPTTAPQSSTGIEGVDFGTFTYDLAYGQGAISLVDGTATRGVLGDAECLDAAVERVLKGDIDGDGQSEAAVTLSYGCSGGTGRFTDVYVFRWDGQQPVLVARDGVGDRAFGGVRWTDIVNGQLQIDRYVGVAACCPTSTVRHTLELQANRLVERGAPLTLSQVYLGDNTDASGEEPIHLLPGTVTVLLSSTAETVPPAGFDARRSQRVTLKIDDIFRDSRYAPLDVVHDGTVLGTARPSAPLTITLPADGHYQLTVVPENVLAGSSPRRVEAELTITG